MGGSGVTAPAAQPEGTPHAHRHDPPPHRFRVLHRSHQRIHGTRHGCAGDYLGMQILSILLIICTLGIATPWAVCMRYRWRAEHTLVNGRRLRFTGKGSQLAGDWFVTLLLIFVTVGIYSFWVAPRFTRFEVEHQVLA